MSSQVSPKTNITLYTNIWTTVLMVVFFFISGLAGQQTTSDRVNRPFPPNQGGQVPSRIPGNRDQILRGKEIVIDPGHGGSDPGTLGVGRTTEAANVLAIAHDLKGMLENAGANVIMTRRTDVNPAQGTSFHNQINGQLAVRTFTANRSNADIFISIHNDWNDNRSISGTTSYYYHSHDWLLADSLQRATVKQLGSRNVGVRRGNFYVLRNTTMPSALIEVGFLSNASEADLLAQNWYRLESARGIYHGIIDYFQRNG